MNKNIVLTGMPGSGKSSVGKQLAIELQRPFYDLDVEIVSRYGKSIDELFAVGEKNFRDTESQVTIEVAKEKGIVIATGGGTILRQENVEALKKDGLIIFIDRPLEGIASDMVTETRPLLREKGLNSLDKIYRERIDLYRSTADLRINNDGIIEKVLVEIIRAIENSN